MCSSLQILFIFLAFFLPTPAPSSMFHQRPFEKKYNPCRNMSHLLISYSKCHSFAPTFFFSLTCFAAASHYCVKTTNIYTLSFVFSKPQSPTFLRSCWSPSTNMESVSLTQRWRFVSVKVTFVSPPSPQQTNVIWFIWFGNFKGSIHLQTNDLKNGIVACYSKTAM